MRCPARAAPTQTGVTLIELMVTVAVLAIMTGLAAPSFTSSIRAGRLASAANDMKAALAEARQESLRRGNRVVICNSSNGTSCATGSDWSNGWISFQDSDGDGVVDSGEPVLRRGDAVSGLKLLASSNVGNAVSFRPDGRARTSGGALLAGTLAICYAGRNPAENVRDIRLRTGSQVALNKRDADGACASPSN